MLRIFCGAAALAIHTRASLRTFFSALLASYEKVVDLGIIANVVLPALASGPATYLVSRLVCLVAMLAPCPSPRCRHSSIPWKNDCTLTWEFSRTAQSNMLLRLAMSVSQIDRSVPCCTTCVRAYCDERSTSCRCFLLSVGAARSNYRETRSQPPLPW